MQRIHLAVAGCAAALAGAISGAAMNTTPLERGIDGWNQLPRHVFSRAELAATGEQPDLPDHYPIVTPQGRFEVGELRDRGLYRNRRFGMSAERDYAPEPAYEIAAADYRYIPGDAATDTPSKLLSHAVTADSARDEPVFLAADAEPLPPPEAEVPPALKGQPRVIDVKATLAAR